LTADLRRLLEDLCASAPDLAVQGIQYDSRLVRPGDCFVAVPGEKSDGGRFIDQALARGAVAVISESGTGPRIHHVKDARRALSVMAARFHGEPSRHLGVVGITGTKGKTTTSYFLESVLEKAGMRPGVLGTVDYRWPGFREEAGRTTPESADLQRMLARMLEAGSRTAVMEVSSHALVLGRVRDVAFRCAVFTNLASDHLDYHKTLEAYRDAKGILFRDLDPSATAVLNADDPVAERYRKDCKAEVLTYGMEVPADFKASILDAGWESTRILLDTPKGKTEAVLHLIGRHNVMNALAAGAAGIAMGLSASQAAEGLSALTGVPGRLERIACGLPFRVFVDYAHTEESLRSLLKTARSFTQGRVLLAFGCGGDRDRTKRPRMGAVAQEMADVVVATSDNPRSEEPLAILAEVRAGMTGSRSYHVEADRAAAIRWLTAQAKEGDTVLIAGKGHEPGQILKDRTVPFDDREEALKAVRERGG